MIQIPEQLNKQRFILIRDGEKAPREGAWPTTNNYEIDNLIFTEFLKREQTTGYGVLTGYNNLIVVDFDNAETESQIKPLLPKTFTVRTASKKLSHLYYYCEDTATTRIDKDGKRAVDVQGLGAMVIGPNSKFKSSTYDVTEDLPIAKIDKKEILNAFKNYDISTDKKKNKKIQRDIDIFRDPTVLKIKEKLKIRDVLRELGIPTDKNPTECPLGHKSEGGKCFSYTDDLWNCFHCGQAGDVFTLKQYFYPKLSFAQLKNKLYDELFVEHTAYDEAMKNLAEKATKTDKTITTEMLDSISKKMIRQYKFITTKETDEIYYYDEDRGLYAKGAERSVILPAMYEYFSNLATIHINRELVARIKALTYEPTSNLDNSPDLLLLQNGVFNLNTKILMPFDSAYKFTKSLGVSYNREAICEKTDAFIQQIVTEDKWKLMYEIPAFCLMPEYSISKSILLEGSGDNGKSVYLHLLITFLGRDNVSSESIQQLSKDKFSKHCLYNKWANIYADLPNQGISDTSTFKTLTSGKDLISAEQKFKDKFNFVNRAKLIYSCNEIPKSSDSSDAYYKRWIIVIFPNKFEGKADNKNLKEELTTENELSGFFNKILESYYELMKTKTFSYTPTTEDTKDLYDRLSNPIGGWVQERIELDVEQYIPKDEAYDDFREYCKKHKIPIPDKISFCKRLIKEVTVTQYDKPSTDGKTIRCWRGIRFKQTLGEGQTLIS